MSAPEVRVTKYLRTPAREQFDAHWRKHQTEAARHIDAALKIERDEDADLTEAWWHRAAADIHTAVAEEYKALSQAADPVAGSPALDQPPRSLSEAERGIAIAALTRIGRGCPDPAEVADEALRKINTLRGGGR